jgi:23S rRNA pseudouridine1911/1915/1917 synthase
MEELSKVESRWVIPAHMHGLRADQYLQRKIGRISRERAQRIIRADDFLLDGQTVKVAMRVKGGQRASLRRFAPDRKTDIDGFLVELIFENDDLLVVNKPPGLSIHPSANCLYKTLTHWLRVTYPGQKIHPCHRIDKETSGLIICAKNRATESQVKKLFMAGKVKKTYLALVEKRLSAARTISIPLGLQRERSLVAIRMIEDPQGKPAVTKIRPLSIDMINDRTLVLCHPLTGRQHQIRAHLSLIHHPILGDKLYCYGDEFFDRFCREKESMLPYLAHPRHALHAARLRFRLRGQRYIFKCPLPADLVSLLP